MRRFGGCPGPGLAAALALAFGASGCGPSNRVEAPPIRFDTARAWVRGDGDSVALTVEVAHTGPQRARGLQDRPVLDEGRGMVFIQDGLQAPDDGFWMWHTLIPLDLAYVGPGGEVVAVRAMSPCESPVPEWCQEEALAYAPGVPWIGGVEVPLGWLERHGVDVGDTVLVEGHAWPAVAGDVPP